MITVVLYCYSMLLAKVQFDDCSMLLRPKKLYACSVVAVTALFVEPIKCTFQDLVFSRPCWREPSVVLNECYNDSSMYSYI